MGVAEGNRFLGHRTAAKLIVVFLSARNQYKWENESNSIPQPPFFQFPKEHVVQLDDVLMHSWKVGCIHCACYKYLEAPTSKLKKLPLGPSQVDPLWSWTSARQSIDVQCFIYQVPTISYEWQGGDWQRKKKKNGGGAGLRRLLSRNGITLLSFNKAFR